MTLVSPYLLALPEIFLLVMACAILLVGLFAPRRESWVFYLSLASLIVAGFLSWKTWGWLGSASSSLVFQNSFILDKLAVILKEFIYVAAFFTLIYSRHYNQDRKIAFLEFYVLGLFAVLGSLVLVSAYNLLTLYLGLELVALPSYALVALRRDSKICIEAAMKYFVIGAVASGILLYGFSLIFGATHSLEIPAIAAANLTGPNQALFLIGLVFAVVAVAFKLGAVPFHMWVPDVYQGAPTSVTLFIGGVAKISAFALAIRLITEALPGLVIQWQLLLIVISLLSMAVGNIAAIIQTNLKRMLAYSSIAHMGYMLLGFLCATSQGYSAALFYTMSYVLMTLAAFGMILLLSHQGFEAENIKDFAGLNERHPWFALMMLVVMFSLAGIPPLVGFIAKLGVLEALIQVHLVWLAVVAILFAVIGSYYYLRVIKVMYFDRGLAVSHDSCPMMVKIMMSVNTLLVLFVGVFPAWLFDLSRAAF